MCAFQQQKPTRAEMPRSAGQADKTDKTLLYHHSLTLKGGLNELLPDANLLPKKKERRREDLVVSNGKNRERHARLYSPSITK